MIINPHLLLEGLGNFSLDRIKSNKIFLQSLKLINHGLKSSSQVEVIFKNLLDPMRLTMWLQQFYQDLRLQSMFLLI
jgi:hypothetical protein